MNCENSNWDYFLKYIVNPTDQLALRRDAQKAKNIVSEMRVVDEFRSRR